MFGTDEDKMRIHGALFGTKTPTVCSDIHWKILFLLTRSAFIVALWASFQLMEISSKVWHPLLEKSQLPFTEQKNKPHLFLRWATAKRKVCLCFQNVDVPHPLPLSNEIIWSMLCDIDNPLCPQTPNLFAINFQNSYSSIPQCQTV